MSDLSDRIAKLSPEQRALLEKRLGGRVPSARTDRGADAPLNEPIAIIGMGCRFPGGVNNVRDFWTLLRDGVDAITEVPGERWNAAALFDADPTRAGHITSRWGGFIVNADKFDAAYFGISPREAVEMDPQQRILLEVACEALDNAGQSRSALVGSSMGVFMGVHGHASDYLAMQNENPDELDSFSGTGTAHNLLAGRLSYMFDVHGPAVVVDTACSSSLVAVHLAVQSLRSGEASLALAGGVNLILSPNFTIAASRMHMLAPDGRCKAFDQRADGFVRSEGCGVVVLKRLSDAIASGDPIAAVIRGSAINQDGHTNGITAPNGLAQRAVIERALTDAGVTAESIGYVEAHGTGTSLGDPIEIEGLAATVGRPRDDGGRCHVGSVKTNIGHLEGAAGVAGLIKTALVVQRGEVPPNLHFTGLNPHIDVRGTRFAFPTAMAPWEILGSPRRAGLSSFGWSGTNAHVVLEEAPPVASVARTGNDVHVLPLSAQSPEALNALMQRYRDMLLTAQDSELTDICYTAAARRTHYAHRAAFVGNTAAEIAQQISVALNEPVIGSVPARTPRVAFVFPGQGSQWLGMGKMLLEREPVFANAIVQIDAAILAEAGWSVREELLASAEKSRLGEIDVVQPVLFAIEVALASLWNSWGVVPDVVVGHSMGEVAAAHVAGALTLSDAVKVICRRSRRLRDIAGRGGMAVVELSTDEALQALAGYEGVLSIAVSNGPRSTVIGGDTNALTALVASLTARDVFCRMVKVDVASHSPQVDTLRNALLNELAEVRPQASRIPMCSTVTGTWCEGEAFTASYWLRNLREPVRFYDVLQTLLADGCDAFVEMSPHPILMSAVDDAIDAQHANAAAIPSLRRDTNERETLLASLGQLYVRGCEPNWKALWPKPGVVVPLPDYPWQRERFWLERTKPAARQSRNLSNATSAHPLLGVAVDLAQSGQRVWTSTLDLNRVAFAGAHQLHGVPVLAASAFVEMLFAASRACFNSNAVELLDVSFERALYLKREGSGTELQVHAATMDGAREFTITVYSRNELDGRWLQHATARAHSLDMETSPLTAPHDSTLESGDASATNGADTYAALEQRGVSYGPQLRSIGTVQRSNGTTRVRLIAPERDAAADHCVVAPDVLDACFQIAVLSAPDFTSGDQFELPTRVARIRYGPTGASSDRRAATVTAHRTMDAASSEVVNVTAQDERGAPVLELNGLRMQAVGAHTESDLGDPATWLYDVKWDAAPLANVMAPQGRWLVLANANGASAIFASEVSVQLTARGATASVVHVDDALSETLADARRSSESWSGVIHCASLDAESTQTLSASELVSNPVPGATALVAAVRALDSAAWAGAPVLWIVTRGAVAIHDSDRAKLAVAQASIQGMARAIEAEYPDRFRATVDVDADATVSAQVAQLLEELGSRSSEPFVALRSNARFVQRLVPQVAESQSRHVVFRSDASYLLTGGLRGVGLHAAHWMIAQGARRLVIFGRTALPPRSEWNTLSASDPGASRVRALQQLESLGASVHYVAADVSDTISVKAALDQWKRESWPAIRGVIHSAAIIEDRVLAQLDEQSLSKVFAPKALGGWVLHEALPDVDWFVLFSSLSSLWPSPGHWGYAAANAFLDALALYRNAQGKHALSVSWGLWADTGFGATEGGQRTRTLLAEEGVMAFAPADGLKAFETLLSRNVAHAAVVAIDKDVFAKRVGAAHPLPLLERLVDIEPVASAVVANTKALSFVDTLMLADKPQRAIMLEARVSQHASAVLRLTEQRIDVRTPLGSYGLNSILGLELRHRLERDLGLRLSATLIWNYPSVTALATHLGERLDPPTTVAEPVVVQPSHAKSVALDGMMSRVAALSDDDALAALRKSKPVHKS